MSAVTEDKIKIEIASAQVPVTRADAGKGCFASPAIPLYTNKLMSEFSVDNNTHRS